MLTSIRTVTIPKALSASRPLPLSGIVLISLEMAKLIPWDPDVLKACSNSYFKDSE